MANVNLARAVASYERGVQAIEDDDLSRAMSAFQDALRLQPNYLEAIIALGAIHLELGDVKHALNQFTTAVRLEPSHPIALGYLGITHFLTGNETRALDYWEQAIHAGPEVADQLALFIGQTLTACGLFERVREVLTRLVERMPTSPEAHIMLAITLFELEDYAGARVETEQALLLNDTLSIVHHYHGLIAMIDEDFTTANEAFTREHELDPKSPLPAALLALTQQILGEEEKALMLVREVLQQEELDSETILTCARVYANAEEYETAMPLLQDVLAENPDEIEALCVFFEIATITRDYNALQWLREEIAEGNDELLQAISECEKEIGPVIRKRGNTRSPISPSVKPATAYLLRLELANLQPPIWRSVQLAGATTLAELHQIIQAVMGWGDEHMHEFTVKGVRFSDSRLIKEGAQDERKFKLAQIVSRKKSHINYCYDFGDDWKVRITVQDIVPLNPAETYPLCLAGERAAPPDDCGGIHRYAYFAAMIKNSTPPDNEEDAYWLDEIKDPEVFDIDHANERLRRLRKK